MFLDEARLAGRIQHPNAVATLDVVALEGELFLVIEYVLGECRMRGRARTTMNRFLSATHEKRALAGLLALAALGAWPRPARADIEQECSAAYEKNQAARKEGRLREAREQAIFCSQDACTGFVKTNCAQWLTEIEASLPTVVFEVRDAGGAETSAVRVLFDGRVLKERLDGKAVPVDPGEHTLRYELGGAAPIEERVVIREGEKNRKLAVSFASGGAPAAPVGGTPPAPDAAAEGGGAPAIAYVLGAAGVVGVGLFATFGILGTSEKGDLEDTCAPNCTDDQVSAVRTKLLVADISLGVGVVSLGVATYLFLSAPSKPAPASAARWRVDWRPAPGGGVGTLGGAF